MTVKQKFMDILIKKYPNYGNIYFSSDVRPTIEYAGYFGGAVFLTDLNMLVVAGKKVHDYTYSLLNEVKIKNFPLERSVTFKYSYANNRLKLNFKDQDTLKKFAEEMERRLEYIERDVPNDEMEESE